MAKDFRVTDARAKAAADALLGTAANSGILRVYADGLKAGEPATPTGDLLAELTMGATAFKAAVASTSFVMAEANAIAKDSSANNTGTAGCFVLFNSAGTTPLCAGTVGTSDADCVIDNVAIAAGAEISASAFKVYLPKGWTTV